MIRSRYSRIRTASAIAMGCFLLGLSVASAVDTPVEGDKSSFSGVVSNYDKASGQVTIEYGRGDEKETVTVRIGEETKMLGQDLVNGSVVTMRGEFEKGTWQAKMGFVKPSKPRFDTTVGTAVGISGDVLTVLDKDGKKQEYKVPEGTSIQEGQVLIGVVGGDVEPTKGPRIAFSDGKPPVPKTISDSANADIQKMLGFTTASAIEKRLKKAIDPDELDKAVSKGARLVKQTGESQETGRAVRSHKYKRATALVCGASGSDKSATATQDSGKETPALCLADEEIGKRISEIDKQILLDEEKLKVKAQGLGSDDDTTRLECRTQDKQGLGSDDEACWIAQEQQAREYKDAASKLEILRDKKEQFIQEQLLRAKDATADLHDQDSRDQSKKRVLNRTTDVFKRFTEMKASLLGKAAETTEQVGSNFKTLVKSRASDVLKEKKDFEDVAKKLVENQDKEKEKRVAFKEKIQKDRLALEQDLEKAKERKYQATEERDLADRKFAEQKRMVGGINNAKANLKALQEKDPEAFSKLQREFPTQNKEGINLPALVRSSFVKYGTMDLGKMMASEVSLSAEKRDEQRAKEIKAVMEKSDSTSKVREVPSKEKEIEAQKKLGPKAQALQKIPLDKLKSLGVAGKNLTRIKKDYERTVTASVERIDKEREEKRDLQDVTRKQYADVRSKVDFDETKKTIVATEKERTLLREKQRADAVKGGDATKLPTVGERKPSTGRADAVNGTTGQQSPATKEALSTTRAPSGGTDTTTSGQSSPPTRGKY